MDTNEQSVLKEKQKRKEAIAQKKETQSLTNKEAKQIEETEPISAEALLESMSNEESKTLIDKIFYLKKDDDFPTPMRREAFRGVAGKIVDLITEDSELCP